MSDKLRHANVVNAKLTEDEYEHANEHVTDDQAPNDMLYFNGTNWVSADVATIGALLGLGASAAREVMLPLSLDLSGRAHDEILFTPFAASTLVGYRILYAEGSSADAGTSIRIGKLEADGSFDNDYYDLVVSEVSKVNGYSKEYESGDLSHSAIAAGEIVTVGTTGAKVGAGAVMIILYILRD